MILENPNTIATSDVNNLIAAKAPESTTIEYKSAFSIQSDKEKREILADITAFANAWGGDIYFGIEEQDGLPVKAVGIPSDKLDETIQGLEGLLREGVKPRLVGVKIDRVSGFDAGPVVVIRIPKSWHGPHMVVFKNDSKFYTRNNGGKHSMDVSEIRMAFTLAANFPQQARSFRDERNTRILSNQAQVPLTKGSFLVLHLQPMASFTEEVTIEFDKAYTHLRRSFSPFRGSGSGMAYNIDGYLIYSGQPAKEGCYSYAQLYRNGRIEGVQEFYEGRQNDPLQINVGSGHEVMIRIGEYLELLTGLGINLPIAVMLSIVKARGKTITVTDRYCGREDTLPIDRDIVVFPEMLVEDDISSLPRVLRPFMDTLWSAAGKSSCQYYDKDGNYILSPYA